MKMRSKFPSVALVLVFVVPLNSALAATPIKVRLGTLAPKGSSYTKHLQVMGEAWRQAPGGGALLTIYPDGTMGSEADMVRRMRLGQLQAAMVTASGLSEIEPGVAGRTAYTLRVQTGCAEPCAYCIIPSTRGAPTSVTPDRVISEIDRVASAGFKEIALTGVHLGSYGRDLTSRSSLIELLRAIETAEEATRHGNRLDLRIAVDYSSRDALVRAAEFLRGYPIQSGQTLSSQDNRPETAFKTD